MTFYCIKVYKLDLKMYNRIYKKYFNITVIYRIVKLIK